MRVKPRAGSNPVSGIGYKVFPCFVQWGQRSRHVEPFADIYPLANSTAAMLRQLHIHNLAVIEDATIELGEGFNCFTGQTGAGKSLVIGALEILLGLRATGGSDLLRSGATEGHVCGLFEVHDAALLQNIADAIDQSLDPGDQLLIRRKIFASGRSGASVNGQPATAAMLRTIGQLLVDVHGRHDNQFLLKPSNQLWILDAFGRSLDLRNRFGKAYAKLQSLLHQQEQLSQTHQLRQQQLELYTFQAQEIDQAQLEQQQWGQLQALHLRLNNLVRIKGDATATYAALHESEGSILERLHMATRVLVDLEDLDTDVTDVAEQVRSATLSLQEAAYELGRYTDRLEVDPGQLSEVEDQLNTINRLVSKYGERAVVNTDEDPVAHLLLYRQQIGDQIIQLREQLEDLETVQQEIVLHRSQLEELGSQLRAERQSTAARLKPLVEAELAQLGMSDARCDVVFESVEAGATGFDRIEMMIQANPGQASRALRLIASGGETSRIMLALKSILAHSDRISVLVFDEIDANIGGRMGTVIGTKLRELARGNATDGSSGPGHQVLCITHLPQIAAFADRHLHIAKLVKSQSGAKQTSASVSVLEGNSRVDELAEMLTGKDATATTRKQVRELLQVAAN